MSSYIKSLGKGKAWEGREAFGEENDCVIRAIVNASEGTLTYEKVHAAFAAKGRVHGGPAYSQWYMPLMREWGFTFIGVHGDSNSAQFERKWADEIGMSYRVMKGMTFGNAIAFMQRGSYVVSFNDHLTAVCNGFVIDGGAIKAGKHVSGVWKFRK